MPRVATKLIPTQSGGWMARKVIPVDVQAEYERLYGVRCEARFNSGDVPILAARAKHREWSSSIETRIANIRAQRRGEGRMLSPRDARALAAEWYRWFTERHLTRNFRASDLEERRAVLLAEFEHEAWDSLSEWRPGSDPFLAWWDSDAARRRVRPMVADWAESAQFLAAKSLTLDPSSQGLWLDFLCRDFFAALELLIRRARTDYGTDEWTKQFPEPRQTGDPAIMPWTLFERWVDERKPRSSTVNRWRVAFINLGADFPERSAASLTVDEMRQWARGLVNGDRSPKTVSDIWVRALRTVFAWALEQKLIASNPFTGWRITVPRRTSTRESPAFTSAEIKTILSASLAISKPCTKQESAERWVPWLCAYSGARSGEITQLRGIDIVDVDGVPAFKITPEAGTVKTGEVRLVPLHEHIIAQGFLAFVKSSGNGPLFYNEAERKTDGDPTNPRRPRYVKARERIAAWVRALGVSDPELQPNHAWRHTFKQLGSRHDIAERMLDEIVGHAPATVGRGYGKPTLADKAKALQQFPRYVL